MSTTGKIITYVVAPVIIITFGTQIANAQNNDEFDNQFKNESKDNSNIILSNSPLSITKSNSVGLFQGTEMGLNTISVDFGGKRMMLFSGEHPQIYDISIKGNATFGNGHTFGFIGGDIVGSSINNSQIGGISSTEGNFLVKAGLAYKWSKDFFGQIGASIPFSQKTDASKDFIKYYDPSAFALVHLKEITVGSEVWLTKEGVQKVLANMQWDGQLTSKTGMGIQALLERDIGSPLMDLLGGFNFRFAMPYKGQSIEAGVLSGVERNIEGATFNAWKYGGYIMYTLPAVDFMLNGGGIYNTDRETNRHDFEIKAGVKVKIGKLSSNLVLPEGGFKETKSGLLVPARDMAALDTKEKMESFIKLSAAKRTGEIARNNLKKLDTRVPRLA